MLPKIAFIDDEKSILESLKFIFKNEPYKFYSFDNPFEALEKIKAKEFALVIVDLVMPDIKGTEIINQIKKEKPWTECMIMTANPYLVERAYSDKKIIVKPWNIFELREVVRQAVQFYEERNMIRREYSC